MQGCVHPMAKHEVEGSLLAELALPTPAVDTVELEDARWFHLTWLERQLSNSGIENASQDVCPLQPVVPYRVMWNRVPVEGMREKEKVLQEADTSEIHLQRLQPVRMLLQMG